ncbi:MAG: 4-hydroxy-3-methylbut-2-enyl diphosphate reductase [Bacteroidetes bacterium]|jgi:4-hydroxy-3-methylbut-2-en-1-yl diphosphate reductase|nr:4-hydroxy-3-methylbut-2-enyl diphosphate reductase [Bacteroidota bacterium]MBT6686277.1 4-hydroxy-3-methylbut-2-enyl diphosphate reductase [Bacteroidota bacterium]MBT7142629.1 4-hydroxy-3-methylbut-2-enyl diphosphate reductase [Bacteroidota bacterium]MBT7492785.1 4-hydroxy-3-methylbut-2-enyl diphosphate reductase [Bacteroidota bacterium]
MKIEINKESGFCFGVVYAIQMAEAILEKEDKIYCLGDIVHNNVEVKRLSNEGLITIDHEKFKSLKNCKVLLRAHGEPPETYKIALENNIELIDASCPVVLKLQNRIKNGFDDISKIDGQLVIYGKNRHAEVNGLVGQTKGKAIVINTLKDLSKIDFTKPINLFSQTTQSLEGFFEIQKEIQSQLEKINSKAQFISNNTTCSQVTNREPSLREFASNNDVIIFVSGRKSSNGKMLYEVCKNTNPNSYFVSDLPELKNEWLENAKTIGICGATSTPRWLMEKIASSIENLL